MSGKRNTIIHSGIGQLSPFFSTVEDMARWMRDRADWIEYFTDPSSSGPAHVPDELKAACKAMFLATRQAWELDHPQEPFPKDVNVLSDSRRADYEQWFLQWIQSPAYRRLMDEQIEALKQSFTK
jgi:hypothetical protein